MALTFKVEGNWTVTEQAPQLGKRRRGEAAEVLPAQFLPPNATVDAILDAVLPAGARRGEDPALELNVEATGDDACIIAARHESGALTFHRPVDRVSRRRGAASTSQLSFHIPVRAQEARRGLFSKAVKVALIKVAGAAVNKAAAFALPKVALAWEKLAWQKKNLREGWFQVSWGNGKLQLTPAVPSPSQRNLLLIHGTFSDAAGAFPALDGNGFLNSVRPIYADRVYAFNHFTVSRTPEENVRMMLEQLPDSAHTFDVITHSRGGLVLRNLVERRAAFGPLASRFALGRAVLVASPNAGTPLATAERWEKTVGWLANLIEVLPDNPFTTGAEFISEAIVWLARHGVGNLPGLASMDMAGDSIQELQSPPGPPAGAYWALAANYHPDEALWKRLLDVGVDQFYAGANDLVVPTEGGWRFDHDAPVISPDKVACYGAGGNLQADAGLLIHHTNIFNPKPTAAFLQAAMEGKPTGLAPLNLSAALPDRRLIRGAAAPSLAIPPSPAVAPAPAAGPLAAPDADRSLLPGANFDNFHIIILEPDEAQTGSEQAPSARILASYGGARVVEPFVLRKIEGGPQTRWRDIIGLHERIKKYTNSQQGALPLDSELLQLGVDLFETLFPGNVRRLYDVARSQQGSRRLNVILTSMIAWVADKPWEFAFDPSRRSFLATEEIHFVRNVLTAIPAEAILKVPRPLRILVASAQPLGSVQLSIDQETQLIRRGFDSLIEAGAVKVDVLPQATPASIHGYLSTGNYNVIHFIGHGDFDEAKQEGCLVFQDEAGAEFRLGERNVREIFCQRGVSLVFLNACQTGRGGRADFNKGVAQALVAHGLPALVANQYSVLDTSATSFAQHFYWSLSQGMTIGESAREARIAVNYSMLGETIDWAVPVVYAREPNDRMCPASGKREMAPAVTGAMARRRGDSKETHRVAIWDVDHDFPGLEQTLHKLNAAQTRFVFEIVELSAPIDAWDRATDGTVYFHAKRFARRMRSRVSEMKVDYLILLTHHWMTDGETTNLLGWWDDKSSSPMMALSFAGFEDKMQPSGPETERILANAFVAALCGTMTKLSPHQAGAKQCPFYYNGERDFEVVRGPARFDANCRKEVMKRIPNDMPALEKLMSMFDAELKKKK